MHTVIVGSPDDVRVSGFQRALAAQGYPPAEVAPYPDLIAGRLSLVDLVRPGTLVRIESPGRGESAEAALLKLGGDEPDEEGEYVRSNGVLEKGRIAASRQWYLGFRALMRQIQRQLAECPAHRLMANPDDVLLMFDKRACHAHLEAHGIAVPPALPPVRSFDALEQAMRETDTRRVFVKLAHGSSASGVIAYQTNGVEHRAVGAVEMVREGRETKLYNTRKIQTYTSHADIARLIDALCQHRTHVETWIPKAHMHGKAFDLRVVVIGGEAAHTVARLSHSPMTNLHLLNERQNRETVIEAMGAENFRRVAALAEAAMRCFPRSLYAGIDLLTTPNYRQAYVIEVNAFGDLLHDTLYRGMDTYGMELRCAAGGSKPPG